MPSYCQFRPIINNYYRVRPYFALKIHAHNEIFPTYSWSYLECENSRLHEIIQPDNCKICRPKYFLKLQNHSCFMRGLWLSIVLVMDTLCRQIRSGASPIINNSSDNCLLSMHLYRVVAVFLRYQTRKQRVLQNQ